MSRRYLIAVSVVAHAAIAVGLFATGVWDLEKLDYRHRASLALGAMMPGDPGGGGEADTAPAKRPPPKTKAKKLVRDRQPTPRPAADTAPAVAQTGGGEGDGEGSGDGPGSGTGGGGCTDPLACSPTGSAAPVCGNGVVEPGEDCDGGAQCSSSCTRVVAQAAPQIVPPSLFVGLRVAGETQVVPPDPVKTAMLRDGRERTTGSFKVCIDSAGSVSSIALLASTRYAAYDDKLRSAINTWRYRPYAVNGAAVSACSVVTFVYTIK